MADNTLNFYRMRARSAKRKTELCLWRWGRRLLFGAEPSKAGPLRFATEIFGRNIRSKSLMEIGQRVEVFLLPAFPVSRQRIEVIRKAIVECREARQFLSG